MVNSQKFMPLYLRPLLSTFTHHLTSKYLLTLSLLSIVALAYHKDPPAHPEKGDKFQVQAFVLKSPPDSATQDVLKDIVRISLPITTLSPIRCIITPLKLRIRIN